MNEVYEYRQDTRRPVIYLTAGVIVLLLAFSAMGNDTRFILVIWGLVAAMLCWMMMGRPATGIRVDDTHLTLSAWRRPRMIPLSEIAYLRAAHWTDDCDVTIVYKDGREEGTHAADMPGMRILSQVMADRGIPLRDPQQAD